MRLLETQRISTIMTQTDEQTESKTPQVSNASTVIIPLYVQAVIDQGTTVFSG
jgi:hypothetical protein